jgi:hypothetical protein
MHIANSLSNEMGFMSFIIGHKKITEICTLLYKTAISTVIYYTNFPYAGILILVIILIKIRIWSDYYIIEYLI